VGWLLAGPALADLEVEGYAPTAGVASIGEQRRLAQRISAKQSEEEERARLQAESEAARAAAELLERATRPYGLASLPAFVGAMETNDPV
jgi:hypothetical protein